MNKEPLWIDYENKSDAEKILSQLKSIDGNLSSLYCKLHDIDDKLLNNQSIDWLKKINSTLATLCGYIMFFGVVTIVLLYRLS